MTAVKITADFSDILIQSVWRPWLRGCFHSEKALFMALCKGKTELRPEMRKEATDERPEAAGKRVFYPGHGKKKGCGVMLMIYVRGVILMIYVRFVCAFFGCCRQKSGAETGGCNIDRQLISNSESVIRHKRPGRIL